MVYYLNRKENACVIALLAQRKHQSGQHQQYIHHVQYIAYIKFNFVELYDQQGQTCICMRTFKLTEREILSVMGVTHYK